MRGMKKMNYHMSKNTQRVLAALEQKKNAEMKAKLECEVSEDCYEGEIEEVLSCKLSIDYEIIRIGKFKGNFEDRTNYLCVYEYGNGHVAYKCDRNGYAKDDDVYEIDIEQSEDGDWLSINNLRKIEFTGRIL